MTTVEIKKSGKGHNIFINGKLTMWLIGSKASAEKEARKLIKDGEK